LVFDDFELDAERLELRRSGKLLKVDQVVLRLLARLLRTPGQLVTKDELVEDVWEGRAVADTAITVSMARLRKALGDRRGEREVVMTVHGRGYRFVRPVVARSSPQETHGIAPGHSEPPFVGRERVLVRLRHALDEARQGRGRFAVLLGEPGIGKTRVVESFERELAGTDARVVWGFCREAGDTPPLWPWLRLRRELRAAPASAAGSVSDSSRPAGIAPGAGPAVASDLRALMQEVGVSLPAGHGEIELLGLQGPARHSVFDAVLGTFQRDSAERPLVLVLDDVHRADGASLELLRYALDEIAHTRILLIATLRHSRGQPAPRPDTPLPHALGHRNCERIALERLSSEDVASYVRAVVDDPDGRFGRAVFDKCEGNPFFMTELARELQEAEQPDPDSLSVPDAALALVRQRVEKLRAETRVVLTAAAVIGRSFELPLLQATTERELGALMTSLDEAIAAEVVVASSDSSTAFAFGHELLRAVLYDALEPRERRHWHVRVGEALEQRASLGDISPPSELAYHFYAALPASDPRKTVQYCRAAAAASGAAFANVDVVRYMRQAIEALDLLERPSVRLRMMLLNVIVIYGRSFTPREAADALRELMRLAREHDDGAALMRGAIMLNPRPGTTQQPGAHDALTAALGMPGLELAGMRAIALGCLACAPPICFDRERADAVLSEALSLARESGFPNALQASQRGQLYLHGGPAHDPEAEQAREALELLAQQNPRLMPVLPADLALTRAVWALQRGDDAAIVAALDRCATRCREIGPGEVLWNAERCAALRRINLGSWSEGFSALAALHRQAEQRGFLGTAPFCAFDRAVLFGEPRDTPLLDDALRSALELDGSEPPSIWSLKLRALCALGLFDEARTMLRAVPADRLAQLPCDSEYLGTLGHLTRAALALKARDYIAALYPLLEPYGQYYSAHVSFLCEGAVPQLLGMLSHALGRRDEALAQLEVGLRMNVEAGLAPRTAESRYRIARVLLDGGSQDDARRAISLAREAEQGAARYGMNRLARQAAELVHGSAGR
jgi:DNA-binding winged helix-turn-helix (wHTH) protein/tetratricopeptide (TPR) repeat protein